MERRIINPWTWQDEFGNVQANEASGVQRTLYCSGQAANDETGAAVLVGEATTFMRRTPCQSF